MTAQTRGGDERSAPFMASGVLRTLSSSETWARHRHRALEGTHCFEATSSRYYEKQKTVYIYIHISCDKCNHDWALDYTAWLDYSISNHQFILSKSQSRNRKIEIDWAKSKFNYWCWLLGHRSQHSLKIPQLVSTEWSSTLHWNCSDISMKPSNKQKRLQSPTSHCRKKVFFFVFLIDITEKGTINPKCILNYVLRLRSKG